MTSQSSSTQPDFYDLYSRFEKLPTGARADIRRLADPDGVWTIPGAYRLLPAGQTMTPQWSRIIFLLPWARSAEPGSNATAIGRQLAEAGVSEMRLFQVVRSEFPNDLVHFRRLLRQAEPRVDWNDFGRTLYFWSHKSKRRIAEQYFLALRDKEGPKSAGNHTTNESEVHPQ